MLPLSTEMLIGKELCSMQLNKETLSSYRLERAREDLQAAE